TSRSQTITSDARAGTEPWNPFTLTAEVPELYASTEGAVATHQFGRPRSRESRLTRSLMTPPPTDTRRSGDADFTPAASRSTRAIIGCGFGRPGSTRSVMRAVPAADFHRAPAAAS